MDATKLLTEDHRKVRALLKDLNETTDRAAKTRTELLEKIALELQVHNQIEEEIFYPAFKQACQDAEGDKLYFEADEEEDEMFTRAREVFLEEELATLGEQLAARKKELLEEMTTSSE